jgi:hypothetical protein
MEIESVLELYEGHLPQDTLLTIEQSIGTLPLRYIFRLQYKSKSSGRTMVIMAKGESLPSCLDSLFYFYLKQLILSPSEVAREFSKLYFIERRARQDAFLAGDRSVTVSDKVSRKDALKFEEYV